MFYRMWFEELVPKGLQNIWRNLPCNKVWILDFAIIKWRYSRIIILDWQNIRKEKNLDMYSKRTFTFQSTDFAWIWLFS